MRLSNVFKGFAGPMFAAGLYGLAGLALAVPWQIGTDYNVGDVVTYNDDNWVCAQAHHSQAAWIPPVAVTQWNAVPDSAAWEPRVSYLTGDKVSYQGRWYLSVQSHVSQSGWEPPVVPALWRPTDGGGYCRFPLDEGERCVVDDFERPAGVGLEEWWTVEEFPGHSQFIWQTGGCIEGSRCLYIDNGSSINHASWRRDIPFRMDAYYSVIGWTKGQNVGGDFHEGAGFGVYDRPNNSYWSHKGKGTWDWTEVGFTFQVDEWGASGLDARHGQRGAGSTGQAWFDNLQVERLTVTDSPHIVLALERADRDSISEAALQDWVANLNRAHQAMADLTGITVFDPVKIMGVRHNPGGWAVAGNPIQWWRIFIESSLHSAESEGDWIFGILHELGHDFDHDAWNFDAEFFASFKAAYVIDTLPAKVLLHPHGQSPQYLEGKAARVFFERHPGIADRFIYRLLAISDVIGWEAFKATFRDMRVQSKPDNTRRQKFDLFITLLSQHSGIDVTGMIPAGEQAEIDVWLGTQ